MADLDTQRTMEVIRYRGYRIMTTAQPVGGGLFESQSWVQSFEVHTDGVPQPLPVPPTRARGELATVKQAQEEACRAIDAYLETTALETPAPTVTRAPPEPVSESVKLSIEDGD